MCTLYCVVSNAMCQHIAPIHMPYKLECNVYLVQLIDNLLWENVYTWVNYLHLTVWVFYFVSANYICSWSDTTLKDYGHTQYVNISTNFL